MTTVHTKEIVSKDDRAAQEAAIKDVLARLVDIPLEQIEAVVLIVKTATRDNNDDDVFVGAVGNIATQFGLLLGTLKQLEDQYTGSKE